MGQQQLLFIVLGIIIVGFAIVIGINLLSASSQSSNRDSIVSDLTNLGSLARTHYIETISQGGGNQTFNGWTIPAQFSTNDDGTFTATVTAQLVTLTGIGTQTGKDGSTPVKVINYVTSTKDSVVIIN